MLTVPSRDQYRRVSMNQPDRQHSQRVVGHSQVITGAREELDSEIKRMTEVRGSGKLLLEIFFENGFAKDAQLHSKRGCKK